jgi:hypothetical protein
MRIQQLRRTFSRTREVSEEGIWSAWLRWEGQCHILFLPHMKANASFSHRAPRHTVVPSLAATGRTPPKRLLERRLLNAFPLPNGDNIVTPAGGTDWRRLLHRCHTPRPFSLERDEHRVDHALST